MAYGDRDRQNDGEWRLTTEQQAEIGDILLSARAVSRQMVGVAREQSEEILRSAREEAEKILREAREKADVMNRDAERRIAMARKAEEKAAAMIREAEEKKAAPGMPAEVQEYIVRCVGESFSKLRQQQLDNVAYINEQWRGFLSGLTMREEAADEASGEIGQKEIEERVGAIAREIMEIDSD